MASDAIITAIGIAQVILGCGEIIISVGGDVVGGASCATGAGVGVGVATIGVSVAITAEGAREIGAGVTLAAMGMKNFGADYDEFKKASQEDAKRKKNPVEKNKKLTNGMKMKTSEALEAAEEFLGEGYKDMGNGRFVSADGKRQVRMGDSDILGQHAGGAHMNFDTLQPKYKSIHIFLED